MQSEQDKEKVQKVEQAQVDLMKTITALKSQDDPVVVGSFTISKKLKQILIAAKDGAQLNFDNIDLQGLKYEVKKTGNNFCSRFFTPQVQSYYVCNQCSYNNGSFATMCYCQSCFEPEKHEGHQYYTQVPYTDRAYCDCGRVERFHKQSFCSKHENFKVELSCQITEEQKKQFVDNLTVLLEIGLQNKEIQFLNRLIKYLQNLNQNSVYYNRMTFQAFSKKVESNKILENKGKTYFVLLLENNCEYEKILIHLGGDIRTRLNIIKLLCRQSNQQNMYGAIGQLDSSSLTQLFNVTAIESLMEENFYDELLFKVVMNQKRVFDRHSPLTSHKIQQLKFTTINKLEDFARIGEEDVSPNSCFVLLLKIIQLYPNQQQIKNSAAEGDFNSPNNPWAQYQLIEKQYGLHDQLPQKIKKVNMLAYRFLVTILLANQDKVFGFKAFLIEKGVKQQKLQGFLKSILISVRKLTYQNYQQQEISISPLIPLLLLIKDSPSHKQLTEQFWKTMLVNESNKESVEVGIHKMVDVIHFVICNLYNSDCSLLIEKKKVSKMIPQNKVKVVYTPQQEEILGVWFRNFLSERQLISRDQLFGMRIKGILTFKGVGKILNQVCSYSQDSQSFTYSPSRAGNISPSRFPFISTKQNYPSIYTSKITLGDEMGPQKGSVAELLIQLAINNAKLFEIVEEEWKESLQKTAIDNGDYQYAYLYIFALVLISNLCKSKNEKLTERIKQIISNEENLKKMSPNEDERQKIIKLLGLQKPKQTKIQEKQGEKQQNEANRKKLGQQKKKKIQQKYKHKQQVALERIMSLADGKASEQQQLCILCHEKQKPNYQHYLVYLSSIVKNKTICSAFYGKNNASKTLIATCFHAVHIKCYVQLVKNNGSTEFECPLCKVKTNSIIPTTYNKGNKQLNQTCRNSIVAHMVTKQYVYNVQSDFLLLFKHLVESKGLNSLLYETRYQQKKKVWQRTDNYLLQIMENIFENSTKEVKQDYLSKINEFEKSINECSRQECKNVQLLFTFALKSVLTSEDQTQKLKQLLTKVREQIIENQYMIVHEQLCRLLQSQIDLPVQTEQQLSHPKKALSFNLAKLPEKASEAVQFYKGKNCATCEGLPMQYICLFCGKYLCSNCKDEHSAEQHNKIMICIQISSLRVECNREGYYACENIYENDFRISFYEKPDNSQGMDYQDEYYLNEVGLKKIVSKFLES